uniref:Uncharacterized protein n=1 Tax=Oryza meridionalis TaxID=40149 RepID=A0A0E0EXW4_9ORYZ
MEAEKKKTPVALAPNVKPLAGKKLCKRTLKLRGVKEVVKSIRRCRRWVSSRRTAHGEDKHDAGGDVEQREEVLPGLVPSRQQRNGHAVDHSEHEPRKLRAGGEELEHDERCVACCPARRSSARRPQPASPGAAPPTATLLAVIGLLPPQCSPVTALATAAPPPSPP